jgi:hypothetical protein
MTDRYLTDLIATRSCCGRPATPQDFQDAHRVLQDAYSRAVQHADEVAACMALTLLGCIGVAAGKPAAGGEPVASPGKPYGPRVSRKLAAIPY